MSAWAVIAAAGSGQRMASGGAGLLPERSKILIPIADGPCSLELSLAAFAKAQCVSGVVLAVRESEGEEIAAIARRALPGAEVIVVQGGGQRQESVYNALQALPAVQVRHVLIHDAARPLCPPELIRSVLEETVKSGACIPALPVKATLKSVVASKGGSVDGDSPQRTIVETIPRTNIYEAQTPQGFLLSLILEAHHRAVTDAYQATDDSELVERLGYQVSVVQGSERNVKLTTPNDLSYLEFLLGNIDH